MASQDRGLYMKKTLASAITILARNEFVRYLEETGYEAMLMSKPPTTEDWLGIFDDNGLVVSRSEDDDVFALEHVTAVQIAKEQYQAIFLQFRKGMAVIWAAIN